MTDEHATARAMERARTLLAFNLGSSTLKAAWFELQPRSTTAPGFTAMGRTSLDLDGGPGQWLAQVVDALDVHVAPDVVAHRIVHGGEAETARQLDAAENARLHALASLAPLHQPQALALARNAAVRWPGATACGVYDTAWHARLPPVSRRLPVPASWDALGVKRYGFHGLAFASGMRLLEQARPGTSAGRIVLAHLGGGSSLCAVHDGQSIDTTMAMTPLDGLPMASRSGSLDPGVLLFLLRRDGLDIDALEQALYHDCGMRGISGLSGDVRELLRADTLETRLALEQFMLRVAQGIAALAVSLGGLDDLGFSGGIGANSAAVRTGIVAHLDWLGLRLDATANARNAVSIGSPESRSRLWCIHVDEESEIARACLAGIAGRSHSIDAGQTGPGLNR
jgi:acetate kinase